MNVSDCVAMGLILPEQEVSLTSDRHVLAVESVGLSLLTVFTVFANVTVIIALVQTIINDRSKVKLSHSSNGKITKLLMASMAVSDSFLGAFIMPMSVLEVIHNGIWVHGLNLCIARYCLDYLLSAASTLHILAMTLDRYLAVCHTLRYRLLTNKHTYTILTLTWVIPFGVGASWLFLGLGPFKFCFQVRKECNMYNYAAEFLTVFISSFVIPFIVVYILYFCILLKLAHYKISLQNRKNQHSRKPSNRHAQSDPAALPSPETSHKNIHRLQGSSLNSATVEEASHPNVFNISSLRNSNQIFTQVKKTDFTHFKERPPNRKTKTFRTIGVVMIGFTICWLPSWILALVFLVRRYLVPHWFMVCITWFGYINSAISPVLYCCNRSVRRAVRSLLCPHSMMQ